MGISFSNFIHSELPARANSRDAVLSSLRAEARPIPEIDSENDLIAFVASHPDISIPPYGALSCIYDDWREYQFQQEKRGGAE